eukprot:3295042-Pyramimonas_sp.AAC.1
MAACPTAAADDLGQHLLLRVVPILSVLIAGVQNPIPPSIPPPQPVGPRPRPMGGWGSVQRRSVSFDHAHKMWRRHEE